MAKHRTQYSWRGHIIRLISVIVRALATLQATLIMKDKGPVNRG